MTDKLTIAEEIERRFGKPETRSPRKEILSKEALDALELSERYHFIEPEPYILPLHALTGFAGKGPKGENKRANRVDRP